MDVPVKPAKKPKKKSKKQLAAETRADVAKQVLALTAKGFEPEEIIESVMSGRPVGRPAGSGIDLDLTQVTTLASKGLSIEQTAAVLTADGTAVNARTLKRRKKEAPFAEAWERGQDIGKGRLRARMFNLAMQNGNLHVAERAGEFLLERWDEWSKAQTVHHRGSVEVEYTSPHDELNAKLDQIRRRRDAAIQSRVAGLAVATGATTLPADSD